MEPRIIIYATCQGEYLAKFLRASPGLRGYAVDVYRNYGQPGVFQPPNIPDEALDRCDLLIYHAVSNEAGRAAVAQLLSKLQRGALRVELPYVTSNLYWLLHYRTWTPLGVSHARRYGLIPYRSEALDMLVDCGLDEDEVVRLYSSLHIDQVLNVDAAVAETFSYWDDLDRRADGISVAPFLRERYRNEMLFYMFNHPSKAVFRYMADQLLARLGLPGLPDEALRGQDCGQKEMVPIHPGLAHRLGLRFVRAASRYLVNGRMMGFENYVRMYYRLRRQEIAQVATVVKRGVV
ncbi:WcbI family polysaccharide biosynthesis putative acetyltransferase [Desulfomicrobium baculatum]|uniref:Polysaccharide biosynthesis enzyme WcbI domain-containing protein n=1 Tax=Desulfomicrobium baculatum (strain DSM 4028 / VKM B-1378 / X) TaxID=525897 RepID=C7LT24_DESBD|nr:WcbI family polysaccharide biosynthesis putative acetyltransferase [Desulfomicrobium baculatum]ACU88248.1 conserved hypothetical protein [Desulfomicrobium baculatum DSM 4028]